MSYHSKTIKDLVKEIETEKAFLPAIQRKFVWPRWKIERLFDSIMRSYPIGSFLFWELKSEKAYDYVFYSFLKNYDQRQPYNIRKKGNFLHPEITGVLDGQQRLSSLFLGIQGTHREKLKRFRATSDHAYPETALYLNLLSLPYQETDINGASILEVDRDSDFEFKFLSDVDAKKSTRRNERHQEEACYWFKVGKVMRWTDDPEIDDIFDGLVKDGAENEILVTALQSNKRQVKKSLRDLHKRLTQEQIINYFKVTKEDLDDILKIFIRVNSGGTILSKTDLLFSTIIATWEDGRDEIEAFIKELNQIGDGFSFSNDFLMRCCLVLSDLEVLFKVNSFKSENVERIKENWPEIKKALTKTVNLISSFGFSSSVLTSQNSIIIIAYHFVKGGDNSEKSKSSIRKYLLHALLNNIYSGQGDSVISSLRNALRVKVDQNSDFTLKDKTFSFENLSSYKLPANKTLKIVSEDIEDFLSYRKGASSFFVLALLYPNLRYQEVHFHQDHIHPSSRFSKKILNELGLDEETRSIWQQIKDTIPNLQLMEGHQNVSKNAIPFKVWVDGTNSHGRKNVPDKDKFFIDNFIPDHVDLDLKGFNEFYSERKELIRQELHKILSIDPKETASIEE